MIWIPSYRAPYRGESIVKVPYNKMLNCLQFFYTGDRTGAYVSLASTKFQLSTLMEGEPLFAP